MAITDAEWLSWLRRTEQRVVLLEAEAWSGGALVTRYLSNGGWVSGATDTPAHTEYAEALREVPGVTARLSDAFYGRTTVSYGDVVIDNADGARDSWLDDAWDGRPVRIYIGAPWWAKDDFRLVFSGVAEDIAAGDSDTLVLKLRDRQRLLDKPVCTTAITGSGSTAGQKWPACYGQCFNVRPVLVDSAARRYAVHDGRIQAITALRCAGEVVNVANYTVDLATGTFTTAYAMPGELTADVQGSATGGTYVSTAAAIFQRVLTERAGLTAADVDTASVTAFATAQPAVVGLYVAGDSTTVVDALDTLVAGAGGYYCTTRDGKFQVAQLQAPGGTEVLALDDDDMDQDGLALTARTIPSSRIRLGWDRNWSPGGTLSANVTDTDTRARLTDEWRVQAVDCAGAANFLLAVESEVVPTGFVTSTAASTEATRRAGLFGVLRRRYRVRATLVGLYLRLGHVVRLGLSRVQSGAAPLALVVGLQEDISGDAVEIEVWL